MLTDRVATPDTAESVMHVKSVNTITDRVATLLLKELYNLLLRLPSSIKEPGLLGCNWLWWRSSFLWLGCHLKNMVTISELKNIYRELGS